MSRRRDLNFEIQYTRAAEKFFRQHEDTRVQYEEAIAELLAGDHPERVDVKKIRGKRSDYFRIRLGDYRVVYAVIDGKIIVVATLLAGSRGDVYKKMGGLR